MAGAGRDVIGRIDAAHRQRAGARHQRHPDRRPCPGARRRIDPGGAVDAHLDLLARTQRTAVAAAHRLRRHAGDKVPGGAGVGAQRRHRRHRARRRGVDDDGLRIGGAAGIAGQVGDRDLEIVIGAGRQRGVERPVAGHHSCRAEQRAAIKHLHAGNAGATGVGNRAGKMHPAGTGDEVAVRGPAIAAERHRRERLARRRGVDDDGLRIGGDAGIAGQVGDRDLEIVLGARRQRGVERPVAGHHSCRAEQRAAIKHLHAGNAGAAGVGNRAGKMHPAATGDEVPVAVPLSLLSVTVATVSLGGVASTMMVCALAVLLALPARSVTVTLRLL